MNQNESMIADAAERIFADLADPQAAAAARDDGWKARLWDALTDAGMTRAWVPEEFGGAGAEIADGFALLRVAGRFASPVPLSETLLAGWLLSKAGIQVPSGPMTVAPVRRGDRITVEADGKLNGRASAVPFARQAAHMAVIADGPEGPTVALVETRACRLSEGRSLAGDPLDAVTFDRVWPLRSEPAPSGLDRTALALMGATARSLETAGALSAILDMSVRYANERVAFERPIAKFQAVQHNLARLATETAAAMMAAGSAADAIARADKFDAGVFLEVASARVRSAEAATEGAAIAHQVHGAIGYTREHPLHRFTMRLLAWRDDYGNESQWAVDLGQMIAAGGADELWPLLAARG